MLAGELVEIFDLEVVVPYRVRYPYWRSQILGNLGLICLSKNKILFHKIWQLLGWRQD